MEEDRKENFVSETNIRGIEKKSMNGEEKKKRDSFAYRSFSKKGIRTVRTLFDQLYYHELHTQEQTI